MSIINEMRGHDALQHAKSEHALSARALKQIADHFELTVPFHRSDPEYGLPWFNEQLHVSMYLLSCRVSVDPEKLFKDLTGTKIWKTYMEALEELDRPLVGLITPAFGTKLYIIHNDWTVPNLPKYPRLMLVRRDETGGVMFELLESYLKSVSKLRGA
jgi:hypothetical protein